MNKAIDRVVISVMLNKHQHVVSNYVQIRQNNITTKYSGKTGLKLQQTTVQLKLVRRGEETDENSQSVGRVLNSSIQRHGNAEALGNLNRSTATRGRIKVNFAAQQTWGGKQRSAHSVQHRLAFRKQGRLRAMGGGKKKRKERETSASASQQMPRKTKHRKQITVDQEQFTESLTQRQHVCQEATVCRRFWSPRLTSANQNQQLKGLRCERRSFSESMWTEETKKHLIKWSTGKNASTRVTCFRQTLARN